MDPHSCILKETGCVFQDVSLFYVTRLKFTGQTTVFKMDVAGVSLGDSTMEQGDSLSHQPSLPGPADISGASLNLGDHPFRRWMRGIRRGRATHMVATQPYVHGWPEGNDIDAIYGQELTAFPRIPESQTERSSVASSLLLKTVKTASMSMASLSVFNRPRTNTQASTQRSVCHSSGFSGSDARVSVDSNRLTSTLSLDEGAWKRAVHRRQAIREILNTEITYVAGLKALSDVSPCEFSPLALCVYMLTCPSMSPRCYPPLL